MRVRRPDRPRVWPKEHHHMSRFVHRSSRTFRSALASGALVVGLVSTLASAPAFASVTKAHHKSFPVTVLAANGAIKIEHRPSRIVSLSPTATEDLFAIGAGSQVVAVDSDSNYPLSAPHTTLSAYQPNVEALVHYRPDLVVVSGDEGGLVQSLGVLHIPVLVESAPSTVAGAYMQMIRLGQATGDRSRAEALVASIRAKLAKAVAGAPALSKHRSYYVEFDPTYYSATSKTFIGSIFALFHLKNIADKAAGAASGYPQLSSEYIVNANPNLVFLADTICCGQSLRTVSARSGWSTMNAVRHGDVIALNDDIASRWGPRIVVLADDIENALVRFEKRR